MLVVLAVFPGLADHSVSGCWARAWARWRGTCARRRSRLGARRRSGQAGGAAKENLEALLRVEPLAIEVGLGLVKFVDGGQESPLLKRISGIRRQLAGDLGYLLGPVRVTDNLALKAHEYVISLKGAEMARYELPQGCELAIPAGHGGCTARGQADARAGVRDDRLVGPGRRVPTRAPRRAYTWWTPSAFWGRTWPN